MFSGFIDNALVASGTALWLGLLTSISPCPLASNIAAISYIGKGVANPLRVMVAGILYTAGRAAMYALLGCLLVASVASVVGLSNTLQRVMNQILGPVLVIAGMFLLELLHWSPRTIVGTAGFERRVDGWGLWRAAALGGFFALSFCPVSAAIFFGSLIPLALTNSAPIVMPSIYGIGTGVPVLAFAILVAFGSKALSGTFARVTRIETWARRITGVVFVAVGVYYALRYIFELEIL